MTTASRKSMRPKAVTPAKAGTSSQPVGTPTTRKGKGPAVTVDALVANAITEHGKPGALLDTLEDRYKAVEAANAGILVWVKVAQAWQHAGRSGREFARLTAVNPDTKPNGDPNGLRRLVDMGRLIDASRKGKGSRTLTVREAKATVTSHTKDAVTKVCAEMAAGKDPLGTKASRKATPSSSTTATKRTSRKATATPVTPDTLVGLLEAMIKVAPKVTKGETAVQAAKVAQTLADILTERAVTLAMPVKGTRAAMAS